MPLFSKPQLEHASLSETRVLRKSASVILREATKSLDPTSEFDIFLSHRYLEATHVLGLKNEIEAMGYSVFVDWVEQPDLDRANVTMWTVRWLRDMVSRCACLFYAFSESSAESTWMAWELGYSDGVHGKVAIVPILDSQTNSESYKRQEYLGLYPYVTKARTENTSRQELWINESPRKYVSFPRWLEGWAPEDR